VFGRFYRVSQIIRRFRGPSAITLIVGPRLRQNPARSRPATLRRRGNGHPPFHIRTRSSDPKAVTQVLVDREYAPIANIPDVRVIVDAGANIGAASVFLLEAYPEATVIAIEPDPGNFDVLQRNLTYYGPRAIALRAALWDHRTSLAIGRGHYRDGGAWTFEARAGRGDDEEVEATTVPDLLARFGWPRIDILKIDIERGERAVFQESARGWLDRVRVIAIELHDAECRATFERTVAPWPAEVTEQGQLTVWRRREVV
jgi:FkbM family methyltransferase